MYVRNRRQSPAEFTVFNFVVMRRTKEDAQHTREALLEAAEVLFAQRGVSRTSLQDIAKAAGVTRGAVYWHFKDKAELFNAMMDRTTLPMENAVKALDDTDQPPLDELRRSALDALHRIAHDPRTHRVFDIATHKVEYVDELMGVRNRHIEVRRECATHFELAFRRAQSLGQISSTLDPHVLTVTYHALIDGFINNWMLDPSAFDLVDVGAKGLDMFLRGLRQDQALAT
jgi:TetR/AcrR family acrAB operon transcriptional repressor